jgi:hypothetical protein
MQRPLNSTYNIARDGAPKTPTVAQPVPGQVRQTTPSHEWKHGAPLDDEKEPPIKSHERPIPVHPGTTPKQRAAIHPVANDPKVILTDAANLGRKPRPAEKA